MTFAHMELNTSDPKAAKKFYKGVFGWKSQDMKMPGGVYTMFSDASGKGFGGMQQHKMPGAPSAWVGYISVASVNRTIKKVLHRGGKVAVPATDIGMGILAVFTDPQGATFAIWEDTQNAANEKLAKDADKKKAAKKRAAKKKAAPKKATKKKAAKKKATRKAEPKKAAKKKATRKAAPKKAAKKKATRKAAPKKAAKKKAAPKKAAKKRRAKKR